LLRGGAVHHVGERLYHRGRLLQHRARVVVGDRAPRLLGGVPRTIGDAFLRLRHALAAPRLEQEEVAELVDRLAAKPEVPIDHANRAVQHQVLEPGLLGHFAPRGVGRRLPGLEVTLGEPPVAIGVADQEEPRLAVRRAAEDDAAGRGLALGAALLALHNERGTRNAELDERGTRNAERGTYGPTFASMFRVPASDFRLSLEDTDGEILP